MKTEELSKIMLEQAPEQWPVGVRAFALPPAGMPDTTRARIRGLIREAVLEAEAEGIATQPVAPVPAKPAWRWLAAALVPFVIAVGAGGYFWFTSRGPVTRTYDMVVSHVTGEVARLKDGQRLPVALNEKILEGERLVLGADGVVAIKNEAAVFWLGGEGDFEMRRLRKDPNPDIEVFVHFGNISIRSDYTGDKSVVFSTGALGATMTGTQARFTVDSEYQVLEVMEGSFDVRIAQAPTVHPVKAGEVFTFQTNGGIPPETRPLLDVEKEDLQSLLNRLEAIQKGQPVKEERRQFDTEDEIRAHFGALQEVTLSDGRVYRGYVKVVNDQVSIYTTFNVIEVNRAMVASIKDL